MLKNEENMVKSKATLPLRQMTTYEQYMKFGAMLNPPTLNRWPQDGWRMWSHRREDCTTNTGETFSGFGKWRGKKANIPRENEEMTWSK